MIYFINPPFLRRFSRSQRSPAVTKSNTMYYPLMLCQAAACVKQSGGHQVSVIDACAEGLPERVIIETVTRRPGAMAFIETSTPSIASDIAFACRLKAASKTPVFLVGTHVSVLGRDILRRFPELDGVLIGEWDRTALQLSQDISAPVPGLLRHAEDAPGQPEVWRDLDALPFVSPIYRQFLDIRNYFNVNAPYPMVTLATARGCPFKCRFCQYPQTFFKQQVRRRGVDHVLEEIAYARRELKPASIFFEDDTFTYDKRYIQQFCDQVLQRFKHPFAWSANARADLDYDTLRLMKRAGLRVLCVGFESGNPEVLRWMNKGLTKERMKRFRRDARRAGVQVHGCFIIGAPFEDRASIRQTLDFALELDPDTIQVYPVIVYPGTQIFAEYEQKGLLHYNDYRDWLTEAGHLNTVIRTQHLSRDELVQYAALLKRKFYLRPGYIARKAAQMVTSPRNLRRSAKAFKVFYRFLLGTGNTK